MLGVWSRLDHAASKVGEEVVVCRRPDEGRLEQIEIHCHGGSAASRAILDDMENAGAAIVSWQQWISEAASSQVVSESQVAMAKATTLRASRILLDQHNGALQREAAKLTATVLDRPDDVCERLVALLNSAELGYRLTQPFQLAIVGPPNVGKSSLMNAMVGFQRSIVHQEPGTTRDVLTALTAIDGWAVSFADTAGMRRTDDAIESAGIDLGSKKASGADCVLLVFDVTQPWSQQCAALHKQFNGTKMIVVQNKRDLVVDLPTDRPCDVATSAIRGMGVEELLKRISSVLVPHPPQIGDAVLFTERQVALVQAAIEALKRNNASAAHCHLSRL